MIGNLPKPMASVGGKPFLEYLLLQLKSCGVTNVVLSVGYQAKVIEQYFRNGNSLGLHIRYCREETPLGTAGALKLAQTLVKTQDFLALNGDSFFGIDLRVLMEYHRQQGARVTVALAEVENAKRFGSVQIGCDGQIVEFHEKGRRTRGLVNGGIYVVRKEVLNSITPECIVSLEHEIFPSMIGHGLHGSSFRGFFVDIGTPEDYRRLRRDPNLLLDAMEGYIC